MTSSPQPMRDFPPVEPIPVPESYRQTFLRVASNCMRSGYLYQKYDGGPLHKELARGIVYHRFCEKATLHLIENNESRLAPEIAKDLMQETIVEATDLTLPWDEHDALHLMAYHWAEAMVLQPEQILCVEGKVELEVGGRRITGTIDLATADGRLCNVTDYKTQWLARSQAAWAGDFQTSVYGIMLAAGRLEGMPFDLDHITHYRLSQLFPRHVNKEGDEITGILERTVIVTREELLDRMAYLEAHVAKIDQAFTDWRFEAQVGAHCNQCAAKRECPIPAHLRGERGTIETLEDAQKVANRWFLRKQRLGEEWEALKDAFNRFGPYRFGKDQIVEATTINEERIRSKPKLRLEVDRAVEFGTPFNWEDHVRSNTYQRMKVRTLEGAELAALEEAEKETLTVEEQYGDAAPY